MAARTRWWDGDPNERFWMEITDRDDLGSNLHAPKTDSNGNDYWSYSFVSEVRKGDVVLHWWKRSGDESAIVGWSTAVGSVETSSIVWQAHGTVGRARGQAALVPSWRMPLSDFAELERPVSLRDVRRLEPELRAINTALRAGHKGKLYLPFAFSDKRPLRATQGYLVKVPAAYVAALPGLLEVTADSTASSAAGTDRSQHRAGGDRRLSDTALQLAIERHAVDIVLGHLTALGACEDVGTTRPYDIDAVHPREGELHVEVKGSTTECLTIELTDGEVKHAHANVRTLLAVVDQIGWQRSASGEVETFGGTLRLWWDWRPEDRSLVPTRYRYLVADGWETVTLKVRGSSE